MKKNLPLLALVFWAAYTCTQIAMAVTVNPTSNVLGDSASTASTLMYRDSSSAVAVGTLTVDTAITVPAGSIDTTKITGTFIGSDIASQAIDTTKLLNIVTPASGTILCYTNDGKIGKCTAASLTETGKLCTCGGF